MDGIVVPNRISAWHLSSVSTAIGFLLLHKVLILKEKQNTSYRGSLSPIPPEAEAEFL